MRLLLLILLLFTTIYAETSYEKGKKLYVQKACYSCHGHKTEGMITFTVSLSDEVYGDGGS